MDSTVTQTTTLSDFGEMGDNETLTDFIDSENESDPLPTFTQPHFLETIELNQSDLEWDNETSQISLVANDLSIQDQIDQISIQLEETLAELRNNTAPTHFSTPIPVTQVKVTSQPSLRRSERVPKKPNVLNL